MLTEAEREQSRGDDAGWRFLHEAERLAVHTMQPNELSALAKSLAIENEAKSEMRDAAWRHAAIAALCKTAASNEDEKKSHLIEAMLIRDEGAANTYFKMRTIRRQMALISAVLVALILLFLGVHEFVTDFGSKEVPNVWMFADGTLLGGIGACLSALTSYAGTRPTEKIPETLMSVSVTLTRALIGAVSGLVAVLAVKAGILASAGGPMSLAPLALGFSERLVLGTLGKVR